MGERTCITSGCFNAPHGRGYCDTHYRRVLAHGTDAKPPRKIRSAAERFWPKVDADGDCWLWTGSQAGGGYGWFMGGKGKSIPAHRWAYEHLIGEVPEGLDLDHLCRVRRCVNPDHLEPVTRHVNVIRGAGGKLNAAKTHCPAGHEYADSNLIIDSKGRRRCRICRRATGAAYDRRQREGIQ